MLGIRIGKRSPKGLLAGLLLVASAGTAHAQGCALSDAERARFEEEHLFGGKPTTGAMLVRRGYVTQYDPTHRVPRWVAWAARQDYRNRVGRSGAYAQFRSDPNVAQPVRDSEYEGYYENGRGYARGHITPYFMGGGDRNANGRKAPSDPFDACTIFEINYMSNIAPQYHNRFNGSGGLWYALETIERDKILPRGQVLHIIAGTLFAPNPEVIGPNRDIGVPDMFYRILVTDRGAVPFLFIHKRPIGQKGCTLNAAIETCIVTVADIEALSGADFFNTLSDEAEQAIETSNGRAVWHELIRN